MSRQKNAAKLLDKECRDLGATRAASRHGASYTFPDGAVRFIPSNTGFAAAHAVIAELHRRYGRPDRPYDAERVSQGKAPRIDLKRTVATKHAAERLALMREQAGLTPLEVTTALTAPSRVRYSERHDSWLWEGDRVAVVATVADDGHATIRTLMWTTNELWAAHPRPEKEPR